MGEHRITISIVVLFTFICVLGYTFREHKILMKRIAKTEYNLPEDADLLSLTGGSAWYDTIQCWKRVRTVYVRVHLQTVYFLHVS